MHEAIKKLYPKLTSTTSTEDGKRVIKVMLSKFAGGSYIHKYMCHGAGAKVGWIKEYRGLTFTM